MENQAVSNVKTNGATTSLPKNAKAAEKSAPALTLLQSTLKRGYEGALYKAVAANSKSMDTEEGYVAGLGGVSALELEEKALDYQQERLKKLSQDASTWNNTGDMQEVASGGSEQELINGKISQITAQLSSVEQGINQAMTQVQIASGVGHKEVDVAKTIATTRG